MRAPAAAATSLLASLLASLLVLALSDPSERVAPLAGAAFDRAPAATARPAGADRRAAMASSDSSSDHDERKKAKKKAKKSKKKSKKNKHQKRQRATPAPTDAPPDPRELWRIRERALAAGAPWTTRPAAAAPKLVLVVSTRRGASTETAELIGRHPCAASFNELLVHKSFPSGYEDTYRKRRPGGGRSPRLSYAEFLPEGERLRHDRWLNDALRARRAFCDARPRVVREACGDACVVALKAHLDSDVDDDDAPWRELVAAPGASAVLVVRNTTENYCSLLRAERTHDYGHTPAAHASKRPQPPCVESDASRAYGRRVRSRFAATRDALRAANRTWLELPFEEYVADADAAAPKILAAAGLAVPPAAWARTCPVGWCRTKSWPACGDRAAACLGVP